ncbi:MAG: hypothetical protein EP330_04390 [Deltaproteobacteria bacterium]|nr:MAG: hypothetical protein EP330_04390 [Deltaproteobacteria bacterium]
MLTLLALSAAAFEPADLPLFHRQTYISTVSEPMHWFSASFHDVERAGCRVGIPVNELRREHAVIGCYFPAGRGEDERPDSPHLAEAWREARKLVKANNRRASDLRLHYVGTWQEVVVEDVVPLPAGDNPHVSRLYDHGRAIYAVTDEGIARAEVVGMVSLGGVGLLDAVDEASFFVPEVDPSLAATSILRHSWDEAADPRFHTAERALLQALPSELAAWNDGVRRAPRTRASTVLPPGTRRAVGGSLSIFGRAPCDDRGMKAGEDIRVTLPVYAPLDVARAGAVRFEREVAELDLEVVYELDLPAGVATLALTDGTGRIARATWSVEVELLEDGDRLWPVAVRSTLTDKQAEIVRQAAELREDQLQLAAPEGSGAYVVDVYAASVHVMDGPWLGEVDRGPADR